MFNIEPIELIPKVDPQDVELVRVASAIEDVTTRARSLRQQTEEPATLGLLDIEVGFHSSSIPWYEWMTQPQLLDECATKLGMTVADLADTISEKFLPKNWETFFWMAIALRSMRNEDSLIVVLERFAGAAVAAHEARRITRSIGGKKSGERRRGDSKAKPPEVAAAWQQEVERGTEPRAIAARLAQRFNVTPTTIRNSMKKAGPGN